MKVKFSRCNSNNLATIPQTDGQLIYTKDTGECYLDVNNTRNKVSDIVIVANKNTIQNPIVSKLYFDETTEKLYKAKIENNETVWIDITGATEEYVNNNFLSKTNTTSYIPTERYNPATKDYVDTHSVTFKPFDSSFVTNGTTQQFFTSIRAFSPTQGMAYLGGVQFTDMPTGLVNAEVELYVYPNNVYYCVMRSANLAPYKWECNSHTYRGWEAQPTYEMITDLQNQITNINNKIGDVSERLDEINGEVV